MKFLTEKNMLEIKKKKKKNAHRKEFPTEFLQNLIRWEAWLGGNSYMYQVCSDWMSGSQLIAVFTKHFLGH